MTVLSNKHYEIEHSNCSLEHSVGIYRW